MSLNNGNKLAQDQLPKRNEKQANNLPKIFAIIALSLGIWALVVYFGYGYAREYIETSLQQVRQENLSSIQQLTEEIQILKQEVNGLTERIILTGSTISGSSSLQDQIDRRLEVLDKNLKELEKSLKILQEAPHGKN